MFLDVQNGVSMVEIPSDAVKDPARWIWGANPDRDHRQTVRAHPRGCPSLWGV